MKLIPLSVSLILIVNAIACGQTLSECKVEKRLGGKYKIVHASASLIAGQRVFFITIKMRANKFNDNYLRKVARRIRATYCKENVISVEMWDSEDDTVYDDLTPPPVYSPATRALYYLDRTTGKEQLNYYKNEKVGPAILVSFQ